MIPIHNGRGQIGGYAGRALDGRPPKYKLPTGFRKGLELFNLHRAAATGSKTVIVVEGYFGCLRVHQSGFPSVVALMGCSLLAEQESLLLGRFERVILMLDGDAAGRAASRAIRARLTKKCSVAVVEVPASALGWYLPDLGYNESTSITVAFMFGYGPIDYNQPPIPPNCEVTLTKADDVNDGNCVPPNDYFTYQICFSTTCDINDVNIVDKLPAYVDYGMSDSCGIYDSNTHTVTWDLGDRQAGDSNCFTLTVKVADDAIPGSVITNKAKMYSGNNLIATATERTQVCCDSTIVYVKKDAAEGGDGKSWATAYKELRDALTAIRNRNSPCDKQIWVAAETYKPTNDANQTDANFVMLDGIDMYGHFEGGEDSIDQRNLANDNNATVLSGDIDDDNDYGDVSNVVTAANARLDGFTVKKGYSKGIYCSGCSPTIANCTFSNNLDGIYCEKGAHATITNTFVNRNTYNGIHGNANGTRPRLDIDRCTVSLNGDVYHGGLLVESSCDVNVTDSIFSKNGYSGIAAFSSSNLNVRRCDVNDNTGMGIICSSSDANIQGCLIQRNGSYGLKSYYSDVNAVLNIISDNDSSGVVLQESGSNRLVSNLIYSNDCNGVDVYYNSPEVRNNTIVYNTRYGIYGSGDADVNSNIIWGNTSGGLYGSFSRVNYNCIQSGYTGGGTGNIINQSPQFRDTYYHLAATSPCIDTGDPNFNSSTEKDIDGEDRVMDVNVDMGADEFYPFDLYLDGIVNFRDFAVFARSWKKSAGDANYNNHCDFYNDNKIDYSDLDIFCTHWLYISGWDDIGGEGAYFAEGSGGGEMMMGLESEQEFMPALTEIEGVEGSESAMLEFEQVVDVNELVDWLDQLWQTDEEIRESMSQDEYLEFRESIEESGNY